MWVVGIEKNKKERYDIQLKSKNEEKKRKILRHKSWGDLKGIKKSKNKNKNKGNYKSSEHNSSEEKEKGTKRNK